MSKISSAVKQRAAYISTADMSIHRVMNCLKSIAHPFQNAPLPRQSFDHYNRMKTEKQGDL
jgi:hypothetical protein